MWPVVCGSFNGAKFKNQYLLNPNQKTKNIMYPEVISTKINNNKRTINNRSNNSKNISIGIYFALKNKEVKN